MIKIGKPKKFPNRISVGLSDKDFEDLTEVSRETGHDLSSLGREAIKSWLKNRKAGE